MQVTAKQIQDQIRTDYELWDGEMLVTVFLHQGFHGFFSVALVIERIDAALETRTWDGYTAPAPTRDMAKTWIAAQLTDLSTGRKFDAGAAGPVLGLVETVDKKIPLLYTV